MKIDIVVGNPPYNKDIYLDFVENGHKIAGEYSCFITPAKWQAKGGDKNESFRKNIVPHMSKIVYYPDCTDVFAIAETSGVCYYLTDKNKHDDVEVINKCKLQPIFNDKLNRSIKDRETLINAGSIINERVKYSKKINLKSINKGGQYQVWTNNKLAIGGGKQQGTCMFSSEGMLQYLQISRVVDSKNINETKNIIADSQLIFSANTKAECDSFISFIYTRMVRFLLFINTAGLTGVANPNNDWWRFVPDPGAFDHIFTDQELYAKYNLTADEINIIESVIKERK
jgi:site-specific DNA-methyltransferase (adenine-specific)